MRSGSGYRPGGRYQGNRPPPQQRQRGPRRDQAFDSHGPEVRIRGTAHQIFERYVGLAREAETGGDRIAAENLYQHAEHYFRLSREGTPQGAARPTMPADFAMGEPEQGSDTDSEGPQPGWGADRPGFV